MDKHSNLVPCDDSNIPPILEMCWVSADDGCDNAEHGEDDESYAIMDIYETVSWTRLDLVRDEIKVLGAAVGQRSASTLRKSGSSSLSTEVSRLAKLYQGYVLAAGCNLCANPAPGIACLRVSGGTELRSATIKCNVFAGRPHKAYVSSVSMNISEPATRHYLKVAAWIEIPDLAVTLKDTAGNVASLTGVKNLVVEVRDGENKVLQKKKSTKCSIVLPIKFSKAIFQGTSTAILTCSGSYQVGNETITVEPAELHCDMLKLNVVSTVEPLLLFPYEARHEKYCVSNSPGETIDIREVPCDSPLPTLIVSLRCDDGQLLVPPAASLAVSIRMRSDQEGREGKTFTTTFSSLYNDAVLTNVTFGDSIQQCWSYEPVDTSGPFATGTYTVTVTYVETRSNMESIPKSFRNVSVSFCFLSFVYDEFRSPRAGLGLCDAKNC